MDVKTIGTVLAGNDETTIRSSLDLQTLSSSFTCVEQLAKDGLQTVVSLEVGCCREETCTLKLLEAQRFIRKFTLLDLEISSLLLSLTIGLQTTPAEDSMFPTLLLICLFKCEVCVVLVGDPNMIIGALNVVGISGMAMLPPGLQTQEFLEFREVGEAPKE